MVTDVDVFILNFSGQKLQFIRIHGIGILYFGYFIYERLYLYRLVLYYRCKQIRIHGFSLILHFWPTENYNYNYTLYTPIISNS